MGGHFIRGDRCTSSDSPAPHGTMNGGVLGEMNDTSQDSARDLLGSIHGFDRATSGRTAGEPGSGTDS
jgi:hypothetical protein